MNLSHPDRYIIRVLKSQAMYGQFVVPAYARHNTMYAEIVSPPFRSHPKGKAWLEPGSIVIFDTQGDIRECGEQLRTIPPSDLLCKVNK